MLKCFIIRILADGGLYMEDKKEVVKYHNDLNALSLAGLTEKELNLFFVLIFLVRDKKNEELVIPFEQLKFLSDGDKNKDRFILNLSNVSRKLSKLNYEFKENKKIHIFTLFNIFTIEIEKKELHIQVNEMFAHLINELFGNYTQFELMEFVKLKSVYSKNMFKILKQWETKKEKEFTMEEFRKILAVPENYRISEIDKKILRHIMNELPEYFLNLKLEKIKTGKKVTGLKFTWKREIDIDIIEIKEHLKEITISQHLYNLIKEIQSLTFFQNVMTSRNVEKLIKKYDEKTLIQILKRAKAHTYQQIKSIKYFDSVYESIKAEPIITIKPSEKIVEKEVQNYPPVEKIEKIDITQEEFNKKYKEYLAEVGLPNNLFLKKGFKEKYNIVEVEEKSIQEIKVFTEKDIPENELLGKTGKKLTGAALKMRINKILMEMKRG